MNKLLTVLLLLAMTALLVPALGEGDAVELFNKGYEAWQAGDCETAAGLWKQASDLGLCQAQYNLGYCYDAGQGVAQSYEQAAEYYRLAADQGDTDARYRLGYFYEVGQGVAQSYEQAAEYYRLTADQGHADARFRLGLLYRDGNGVEQSYEQAAECFRLAADQGHSKAQFNLGLCYDEGNGVEQSFEKAKEYYQLAADQGHATAMYNLGILYRDGNGVEQSYEQAAECFRQAADQGLARAQFHLGYFYHKGEGVERSFEQAAKYYQLAADQGLADAQFNLGMMYFNGDGVEQSYEQAAALIRSAADQGLAQATDMLETAERAARAAGATGPDAVRQQAEALGMDVPVPSEGEALYIGVADVPDTRQTKLFLAFIASPSGQAIRKLTMFGYALEIPSEGDDTSLLIDGLSTREDDWIDLKPLTTDIVLREDPPISVTGLKLGNGGATCRMAMSGDTGDGTADTYRVSADIALVNLTGDIFNPAIDPPTRDEAEAAGMELPEPGDGEALYLGAANVSQAGKLYVAFCLSADGASVNRLTLHISDMEAEFPTDTGTMKINTHKASVTDNNPLPVAPEIEAGNILLTDFEIDGDAASAVLHYIHHFTQESQELPFDVAHVAFKRVE